MKSIHNLLFTIKHINEYCLIKCFYYNFISRKVKRDKQSFIFIKRKCHIKIYKNGKIYITKSNIYLNHSFNDILTYAWVKIGENAVWEINGDATINGACINLWKDSFFSSKEFSVSCLTKINIQKKMIFGNNVIIARNCYIADTNSHHIYKNGKEKEEFGEVIIGDDVWICASAFILKNSNIGSNSIISCGTTISFTTPPNTIVGTNKDLYYSPIDTWKK